MTLNSKIQWFHGTYGERRGNYFYTSETLPQPLPEIPLHIRVSSKGLIGGQGAGSGAPWVFLGPTRPEWKALDAQTKGICTVAFGEDDDRIYVSTGEGVRVFEADGRRVDFIPGYIGSQGIRYVRGGVVTSGDATYGDRSSPLHQWTEVAGVQIGQLNDDLYGKPIGLAVCLRDGGVCRVSAGFADFVRCNMVGDLIHITFSDLPNNRVGLIETSVGELESLDRVSPSGPAPQPEPTPMPEPPLRDGIKVVETVRANYPTPLGGRHGEFLIELARALGGGAGLLRKPGGTNVVLPDGTRVSQDVILYPDGDNYDVLGDGEGAARPAWSRNWPPRTDAATSYYNVGSGGTVPVPDPSPVPEPDGDILTQLAKLKSGVETANRRISGFQSSLDGLQSSLGALAADALAAAEQAGVAARRAEEAANSALALANALRAKLAGGVKTSSAFAHQHTVKFEL